MKEQAEKEWYKYDLQRSDATSAWLSREAYKSEGDEDTDE